MKIEEFHIIQALESNPLMTITDLAEQINVTRPTAKKRLENLKEKKVLRDPFAIYKTEALGLRRVNVIGKTASLNKLKIVEKSCKLHPYTYYRARLFGSIFGIFIQYNIPKNSISNLKNFLIELVKKGLLLDFEIYASVGLRKTTYPNLQKYNLKQSKWEFSWDKWYDNLPQMSSEIDEIGETKLDFDTFTKKDFEILRLLCKNSNLKQTEIKDKLGLSKTATHRHYNYVKENYIANIRLMYERKAFDLTETYIAIIKFVERKIQNQFYSLIKKNPPPFHFSIDIIENNQILLWGHLSPNQASDFAFATWKRFSNTEIYILNTKDEGSSSAYIFYPNNFDFEERKWKKSYDYMVKEPLNKLDI